MIRRGAPRRVRRGGVLILTAVLLVFLCAMAAFAIDGGLIVLARAELHRAADTAALAGVLELVPDQSCVATRAVARTYTQQNGLGSTFSVPDGDITIGRLDPTTVYSGNLSLFATGPFDTVRVRLRRNGVTNPALPLAFARVFKVNTANVEAFATAVLRPGRGLLPGLGVLPIAVKDTKWQDVSLGETMTIYGDGDVQGPSGGRVPGNWGLVDIGHETAGGTSDINDQIRNGLRQTDLNNLNASTGPNGQPRIPSNDRIDSDSPMFLSGEPGFKAGMKHGLRDVVGKERVIPIYDSAAGVSGQGTRAEYRIVGWGVVTLVDFRLIGNNNGNLNDENDGTVDDHKQSFVEVRRSILYSEDLVPNPDLSDTSGNVEGAYTSPVLIE